ncbi:hypothetical protein IP91_04057 [Pseudoduganella lurida]|uniref:Uncharacterized protein n=1 Tax=Pseudoduganella lurida TaxID=1036180 RepID=A0A562R0G9_9BURK|nr:hypothetical protein [Pseudoduganella lurida]TWI62537.1 hypothetical protein IP91_04057 [Pseudoduganella lurida]
MLKFSSSQLTALKQLEEHQYVEAVRKNILSDMPELASDDTLACRLEQAYRHAVGLHFVDGAAITQFLYYEAAAPTFYRQPPIDGWLRKPGAAVEQRFYDLIALTRSKLEKY